MLSIIVPVLNEAPQILPFLRHLRARAASAEIIVVDGGSNDATKVLAVDDCDKLLVDQRGRSSQLNAGAQAASGDILWFLHVDCEVPGDGAGAAARALATGGVVGGCFRVSLPDARLIFRVHDSWAHWIGRILRVRCGDHGIFCTRAAFEQAGGYPAVPLMEDVGLVRALHRVGRFVWLPERLLLSARRHLQVGPYWYTFVCCAVVALYCSGVGERSLARLYRRLVRPRTGRSERRPLAPVEDALFAEFRGNGP